MRRAAVLLLLLLLLTPPARAQPARPDIAPFSTGPVASVLAAAMAVATLRSAVGA